MEERPTLTNFDRMLYGAGYLGVSLSTFAITTWMANFYLPPEEGSVSLIPNISFFGVVFASSYLFGFAQSIGRVVDAVSDPFVGYFSDNTRSRWGRRRPYIIFGAPLMALLFLLVFTPPFAQMAKGNFFWLMIIISFFYLFYTIVITPYLALLPEIARTTTDRLKLSAWQTVFNVLGIAIAVVLGGVIHYYFGYRGMALVFALVIMAAFLVPGLRTREVGEPHVEEKMGFWRSLVITLRNRPFLIFLCGQILIWFGFSLMLTSLRHVVVALMRRGSLEMAICMFLTLVLAVVFMPVVFRLTHKIGKKMTYIYLVSFFVPSLFALYLLQSPWIGGYSAALGYFLFALMGIPCSAFFLIPNAIIGEVIDYDEKKTGRRREGIYYSTQALLNKTGLAFSSLLLGYLYALGHTVDNPFGLRLLGPVAGAFVAAGLIVFMFYPLEDTAFRAGRKPTPED